MKELYNNYLFEKIIILADEYEQKEKIMKKVNAVDTEVNDTKKEKTKYVTDTVDVLQFGKPGLDKCFTRNLMVQNKYLTPRVSGLSINKINKYYE